MSVMATDQTTTPAHDQETLPELLRIVRGRRRIVAVAFMLTTGAAVLLSLVTPPVYEASTTLISDSTPPVVLFANSGQETNLLQEQVGQAPDVATFTEIVKSQAVRDAAAARLSPVLGPAKATAALSHVSVQPLRNTAIVRISAASGDPNDAATAANALAQSVIALDLKARRRLVANARKFIGEQLKITRQKLRASEDMVTEFKNQNRDVSLSEQTLLNLRKLADLEARLADVRLQEQEARTGSVPAATSTVSVPVATADGEPRGLVLQGGPDPLVAGLQSQLSSLEVELSGLRKQFTPMHPQVVSIQAKIDETRRRLGAAVARNWATLATREQGLSADINEAQQTLMKIPTREAALASLTRNAKEAERTYLLLSEQFQGARIFEGSIGSSVRIVDVARPPGKPARPNRGLNTILGAVVGLMLGVTAAYAVEQLDTTVRSGEEASRFLDAPVLGVIRSLPVGHGSAAGTLPLMVPSEQTSGVAEEFRGLRTHLLAAMRTGRHKCLLVTSALPSEGKSTIAANLGAAIAQSGRSVWLMDCNLRHPALRAFFPEADSPGLSTLLAGHAVVEDIVRHTSQPRLDCIVSGPTVSSPAELIDTQLMAGLVTAARGSADVILLDGPALLPVADAEVLGLYVDGAIVVVRAGRTDRQSLIHTRERLRRAGVAVMGVVLNDRRDHSARFG